MAEIAPSPEILKKRFQETQGWLLRALNASPPVDPETIRKLEDDVQYARMLCTQAGLDVETYAEWAVRHHQERRQVLLEYAAMAMQQKPLLSASGRKAVTAVVAIGLAAWAAIDAPFAPGWLAVVIAAAVGSAVAWSALYFLFPTPPERIGRRAAAELVDIAEFFPAGSTQRHEYEYAVRVALKRNRPQTIRVK